MRVGDALSVVLVTEISLTLGLSFALAGLGHKAAATTNNAATVKTIDLRMGLLR
jgi:hypothetical protein